MALSDVRRGKRIKPRRILMYGVRGIGKSTFGANAPKPIFIPTEDGLDDIDCDSFPKCETYAEVIARLEEVYYSTEPDWQTVCLDSLDWLEALIHAEVCKTRNVTTIADIGYGKGPDFALNYWRELFTRLDALREQRGMNIVLIAHAKIEKFVNPETETYDRYSPRIDKKASAFIQEWCDEVLFAMHKVLVKTNDEGFNRKKSQGVHTGQRVMRTTDRPSAEAKNRLNLPDELPLDWKAYAEYLPQQA